MSAAPIASGARAALLMTAAPTVKTSPKVPMNSVTYLRICDPAVASGLLAQVGLKYRPGHKARATTSTCVGLHRMLQSYHWPRRCLGRPCQSYGGAPERPAGGGEPRGARSGGQGAAQVADGLRDGCPWRGGVSDRVEQHEV